MVAVIIFEEKIARLRITEEVRLMAFEVCFVVLYSNFE